VARSKTICRKHHEKQLQKQQQQQNQTKKKEKEEEKKKEKQKQKRPHDPHTEPILLEDLGLGVCVDAVLQDLLVRVQNAQQRRPRTRRKVGIPAQVDL
jgi:hypothetical protein